MLLKDVGLIKKTCSVSRYPICFLCKENPRIFESDSGIDDTHKRELLEARVRESGIKLKT